MNSVELRLPGESDDAFVARANRLAEVARVLIDAALANRCIQQFILDPNNPTTEESQRQSPTVRVEFEQAIALGGIGETLRATANKHWGDGPWIMPLQPDDFLYERQITYLFRENSLYNRRYEQRMRLKELLGAKHRKLVTMAQRSTHGDCVDQLSAEQAFLLRKGLGLSPSDFWRVARGREFRPLPEKMKFVSDVTLCQLPRKQKQLMLPIDHDGT